LIRRWTLPLTAALLAFGVLGMAGTASAASPAHPAASHIRPAGTRNFNPGGTLIRRDVLHVSAHGLTGTEVSSENWSGYAVTGADGAYSSVSASWTQPTATCTGGRHGRGGSDTYAAFWVGLDGYSSDSVEQTGTLIECVGSTAYYYGWYEMYPAALVTYSNTVKPGDSFSGSVTFSGTDTYTLTLKDATQGWTQTQTISESGLDRSSAEVITEAPCCTDSGGILPLADFGTVNYTASTDNGSSMGGQSPTEIIIIGANGTQEDSTSSISSSGAFSNTWLAS
jgi:hypothetical protein